MFYSPFYLFIALRTLPYVPSPIVFAPVYLSIISDLIIIINTNTKANHHQGSRRHVSSI